MKGSLLYILQNCQTAFEELRRLNEELAFALKPDVKVENINRIGALHRMTQDYLIVRVAGLFDNDRRTASFQNLCPTDKEFLAIKEEAIIKYFIEFRHNFSAHLNLVRMQNDQNPETLKILSSNIVDILQKLVQLANTY